MTIAATTGASEHSACDTCTSLTLHRQSATLSCGQERIWWSPDKHAAPCGLPCLGGGVKPAQLRGDGVHGYEDRCPRCGPLRVLPEVAAEMRKRAQAADARAHMATRGPLVALSPRDQRGATVAHCGPTFTHEPLLRATSIRSLGVEPLPGGEAPGSWEQAERNAIFFASARHDVPTIAADVLRCLDEIAKLTRERDEARQALDQERDGEPKRSGRHCPLDVRHEASMPSGRSHNEPLLCRRRHCQS